MPDEYLWKLYERQAESLFKRIPGARVERDAHEIGVESGEQRQIDVLIELPVKPILPGDLEIEVPIKIIVDCKHHGRALDLANIGPVLTLKNDVRANLAIVMTPLGISPGARRQAQLNHIITLTVTPDLIAHLGGMEEESMCLVCSGHTGFISWNNYNLPADLEWDIAPREGWCDYCGALHVCCPDCFTIFPVEEAAILRCPNGCACVFVIDAKDYRSADLSVTNVFDSLDARILLALHERRTKRMQRSRIDQLVNTTRWQYWTVDSPLVRLREEDFIREHRDSVSLRPDGQAIVDNILLKAVQADSFTARSPSLQEDDDSARATQLTPGP